MWLTFVFILALIVVCTSKVYDGVCPTVLPIASENWKVRAVSVHFYIPLESEINHLFYPKEERYLRDLLVSFEMRNKSSLYMSKFYGIDNNCVGELVHKQGVKGEYFSNQQLFYEDKLITSVKECGKEWDMYQVIRGAEDTHILWGCVNLPDQKNEQGLWILGQASLRNIVVGAVMEAVNFTQVSIFDLTYIIRGSNFTTSKTNISVKDPRACGNLCKINFRYGFVFYMAMILIVLLVSFICIAKAFYRKRANKIHYLM